MRKLIASGALVAALATVAGVAIFSGPDTCTLSEWLWDVDDYRVAIHCGAYADAGAPDPKAHLLAAYPTPRDGRPDGLTEWAATDPAAPLRCACQRYGSTACEKRTRRIDGTETWATAAARETLQPGDFRGDCAPTLCSRVDPHESMSAACLPPPAPTP